MAGIAQNRQKHLIFIVIPQVRTEMREKGKREKQNKAKKTPKKPKKQQQQHENE